MIRHTLSRWALLGSAVFFLGSNTFGQESMPMGMPQPVTLDAPEMPGMAPLLRSPSGQHHASAASQSVMPLSTGASEKPASVSHPSGILALATGEPFVFEPLPMASGGCSPRPSLSCTGPDFAGCSKRIYYRTNPCDDDPILSLYPSINDDKTRRWYDHALRMITRKKAVTEAIK